MTKFLSSFERLSGGDSKVDTPVPIPNTEVKHFNADGSKLNLARVGSCQSLFYACLAQSVRALDC